MSKFIRVGQANNFFQPPAAPQTPSFAPVAQPGNSLFGNTPFDLTQYKAPPTPKPAPAQANPHDIFAKAGVNPSTYTGSAQDNEKLRIQLSQLLGSNQPTFYDAYVKAYGKWDGHPGARINNLNGTNKLKAQQAKKATEDAKAAEQWKNNAWNQNNPKSTLWNQNQPSIQNPPSVQNLYTQTDPFQGIMNPPYGR